MEEGEDMTRIGVVSDTHLRARERILEEIASMHFKDVDLVLHAGDIVCMDVLGVFEEAGHTVVAVCGNMDGQDVRAKLPMSRTLAVEGVTIGLIHGWGSPEGIRSRLRRALPDAGVIVYGHTHQAYAGTQDGTYFFNPGSPTDNRFTTMRSVGIITVDSERVEGTIIEL